MDVRKTTFVYGLLQPDRPDLVETHLRERNALWNRLVRLHLEAADTLDAAIEGELPAIAGARTNFMAARSEASNAARAGAKNLSELRRRVQDSYDTLYRLIGSTPRLKELTYERVGSLLKQANDEAMKSFLWWPNRSTLLQDFIAANGKALRSGTRLRYKGSNGEGTLYIVFQRPTPAAHLFGKCSTVEITGEGRHRTLRFTLATEGRKREDKHCVTFPMVMHRPLPAGVMVKQVRVVTRRVGSSRKYEVQFVLEVARADAKPSCTRTIAGMDLGWRVTESGMRVASIMDGNRHVRHLELPPEWMLRMDYADDIEAALQRSLAPLLPVAREAVQTVQDLAPIANLLAKERVPATKLIFAIIQRPDLAGQCPTELVAWVKRSRGLAEEQAHLREKLFAQREQIYRRFVAECCERYHTIAMEELDLKSLTKTHQGPAWIDGQRRTHRARAALSEMIRYFRESEKAGKIAISAQNSAYSTCTCHVCGHVNTIEPTLLNKCAKCASVWDQDENSAANFLRKLSPEVA